MGARGPCPSDAGLSGLQAALIGEGLLPSVTDFEVLEDALSAEAAPILGLRAIGLQSRLDPRMKYVMNSAV